MAAGGDVVVSEAPPGRRGWTVAVALPAPLLDPALGPLELRHAAVSTSGDAEQFVTIDGVRYSHIVDPRTGLGAARAAPRSRWWRRTGATADALATAVSVLGPERGLALIEGEDGAAAWIAQETAAGVRRVESRRWRNFFAAVDFGAPRSTTGREAYGTPLDKETENARERRRESPRWPPSS